jgi:hypothetical protein
MQDRHLFLWRKARSCPLPARITAPSLCWLLALWLLAACAPRELPPPPAAPTYPSRVITQDGLAFMVHRLRLPGTRQKLTVRDGGTNQWLPLHLLQSLRFTGPTQGGYRPAEIVLISGEKMRGEIYVVNVLVEGSTDLGYWNMRLSQIERLYLGRD